MRPPGSPRELERRRFRAIELIKQGHAPVEVARMIGCDRRSVRRWRAAFRRKGESALRANPASGRPLVLDRRARQLLEKALFQGAKVAGFETDLWTCPRVAELIRKRFGVNYHVDHVCRILHSLGWSPQKPQRRAMERNEIEIQRWIKEEWPRLKKKPLG